MVPDWVQDLLSSSKPDPPPQEPPAAYLGTLRPYQQRALGFALHRPRTMLALDCGLGKTHIGMCYMLMHLPAVVVCPASLISSWQEHILSFVPSVREQITILSYNKLRPVPGARCLVADEAHYLKHARSQRSQRFVKMMTERVLLLTGTPAQRNVDLYHLLKILDPVHFTHFFHYGHKKVPGKLYFAERYTVPQPVWIGGKRHGYKFTTNQHTEELGRLCDHYMLRMTKSEVVQLPRLDKQDVYIGKCKNPTHFRDRMDEIASIRETRGSRQADVQLLALCRETVTLKLPLVIEYVQQWLVTHPTQKLILFYHHADIGDALEQAMLQDSYGHVRIDGKTTMKRRVERILRFRQDTDCRVGILSLCATSTGLNLQFCTKIMFVEMTFLSVHHTQAESRIHRIGQEQQVSIDYLLMEGTTDTLLWYALESKRKAEETLFGDVNKKSRVEDELVPL